MTEASTVPRGAVVAEPTVREWIALWSAIIAVALLPLAITGTNLAFPAIEAEFGQASRSTLSWILTGYSIALAAFMLLGGQLVDRLGAKRLFLSGVGLFALASAASALAPTPLALIAARVVQGAAGSAVVPASLAVVLPRFPTSRHASVMGAWAAAMPIGAALAPTLSALILARFDWRWVFLLPVPIALGVMVVGALVLVETPRSSGREPVDWLGVPMGTAAVGLLALAIVQGPQWGATSPLLWGIVAVAAGLAPLFIRRSRRHPRPLLDLSLFSVPTMRSASMANVLISMGGLSVWLLWTLLLTTVWDYSLLQTGLAITPAPVITGIGAVLTGGWVAVHGFRRLLLVGTSALLGANVWFLFRLGAEPDYWTGLLPGLALYGVGFALTLAPLNWAALSQVGQHRYGQANAAFNTIRNLAGALGIAVVVAVLGDGDAERPIGPFDRAFAVLAGFAVLSLIVLVVAWPADEREPHPA